MTSRHVATTAASSVHLRQFFSTLRALRPAPACRPLVGEPLTLTSSRARRSPGGISNVCGLNSVEPSFSRWTGLANSSTSASDDQGEASGKSEAGKGEELVVEKAEGGSGRGNDAADEGKLFLSFKCKVCSTTMQRFISKRAYRSGIVIVQCDGCQNRHLIADNLGWFASQTQGTEEGSASSASAASPRNVEQMLAERGESVTRLSLDDNMLELVRKEVDGKGD